jgi:transposase
MKLHANARTCPHSRRLAVDRVERDGWTLRAAAEAAGVSVRTVSKWLRRYRDEGEQGLLDRCSAPGSVPLRTGESRVAVIASLRRLRMTGAEIAETLGMPASTVSGILTRIGLGKLWRLEPLEPPNRYEKKRPGELVHVDVKKLGRIGRPGHRVNGDRRTRTRGIGWEYVHVAIDDATRLVYVEVLDDEKATTAIGFLRRAVAHFASFGIRVERLMTDKRLRLPRHDPRARLQNARDQARDSDERHRALAGWLDFYNRRRPHRSLGRQAPLERLHALNRNNVLGSYN